MRKKIISLFLMCIMVFSVCTVKTEAASGPKSRYQVNTPEAKMSTTKNKVLVSGKAPAGTTVTIDVFGAIDLLGENFNLAKLPKDKDYILISSQNIKSGPVGFGEEVQLIKGVNKIIVTFDTKGVGSVQKIVYYYDTKDLLKR